MPALSMSKLEQELASQIETAGLPRPERQFRFWQGRRFRFDFAWPDYMMAVEVDGGTSGRYQARCCGNPIIAPRCRRCGKAHALSGGRHVRPKGHASDCEKRNGATLMGWRVLTVPGAWVRNGKALPWVEEGLRCCGWADPR